MKRIATFVMAATAALLIAVPAQAQTTVELGIDGGFVWTSPDIDGVDSMFDITLPFQYLRAGFFLNDQFSIEPLLGFDRQDLGNDQTLTALTFLASGLYHFTPDRSRTQFFLQAGGGLDYLSFEDASSTQWMAGAGVGLKTPLMDRLAARFGVLYLRAFENDDFAAANSVRGHVGLSFFTR